MPITREALVRLERILDAMEKAHDAAIIEETLAMTEAEIDSDLRARGIDPDELVKRLRQKLGLETGKTESVARQRGGEARGETTNPKSVREGGSGGLPRPRQTKTSRWEEAARPSNICGITEDEAEE